MSEKHSKIALFTGTFVRTPDKSHSPPQKGGYFRMLNDKTDKMTKVPFPFSSLEGMEW
jgi:hypothetical protein